ncbi:hypothetical protein ABZT26_25670 [Streptomyces sp. NPDC005395]|uniref:hypothetical protein n=1 Tax=Streptomyces sp. NPDC005395 TaxID=3157042 RepID=UPI0033BDFF58
MATVVSTADYSEKIGEDIPARIGGVDMVAVCPKDVVWNELARREKSEELTGDEGDLMYLCSAIFGAENGESIRSMLDDPGNHEVTFQSLSGVVGYLVELWGPQAQEHFEKLQISQGNRATRRLAAKKTPAKAKAPARKTAAKKTAAKKTAAAKKR